GPTPTTRATRSRWLSSTGSTYGLRTACSTRPETGRLLPHPRPVRRTCTARSAEPAVGGVRVERSGPVTTVVLDRPDRRNAVDRTTADELSAAFRAFDDDDSAAVAV